LAEVFSIERGLFFFKFLNKNLKKTGLSQKENLLPGATNLLMSRPHLFMENGA
jgi:hypothetical protein